MTYSTVSLLVVYVADLNRSRAFYSAVCDARFVEEQHGSGPVHYSTTLPGGAVLELYPRGTREPTRVRLGFRVADSDIASREAVTAGGTLHTPTKLLPYGYAAVVLDPDGNAVELVSCGPPETE